MKRQIAIAFALTALGAGAQERIADLRQGTNLAITIDPAGTHLIVDLLGQLWSMPAAGGGATPLTPVEQARQPRYSPDGRTVVYQRLVDGQWDLWLLDVPTGMERPLTATRYDEREPDFTADGRTVVFAANATGHYGLWSIALDGEQAVPLTDEPGDASFPTVSERGLIGYLLDQDGQWSVRVLGLEGDSTAVHYSDRRLSPPTWRPGGGVLVFGEQDSPRSSRLSLLLLTEPRVLKALSADEDLFASRPAWLSEAEFIYAADGQLWRRGLASPGRQPVHLFAAAAVAVASAPADLPPFDEPGPRRAFGINDVSRSADERRLVFSALGDIWLAERGKTQRLTDDAFVDLDPVFWPDGQSVVFASERTGQFELWRVALRESRFTQLTFGALRPREPAIRPDGKQLAYLESLSLEPSSPERLKVVAWPSGELVAASKELTGATDVSWSADGLSVRVRAGEAGTLNGGNGPRIELLENDNRPAEQPSTAAHEAAQVEWQPEAPAEDYVVEVGRLFDGVRDTYQRHVDLHVRNGRIAAIVGRGMLPPTGRIIDARDATVLPGLIDVHVHQAAPMGERLGRAWLAYGVTTIREIAAEPTAALEIGEMWASGRSPGPRLIVTPLDPDDHSDAGQPSAPLRAYPGISEGLVHSLRRQTAELAVPQGKFVSPTWRRDLPPVGNGPELELSPGLVAYQDGFSRLLAADTTLVAGLASLEGVEARAEGARRPAARDLAYRMLFTSTEQAAWARPDPLAAALPALQETVARFVRAGGRMGIGSDAPAVPYGLGAHLEMAALARAGIPNDQILRMATVGGALALGVERQVGTLEEGKLADFVIVNGDPLARIEDALNVTAVVKGGVWHDRPDLLAPR